MRLRRLLYVLSAEISGRLLLLADSLEPLALKQAFEVGCSRQFNHVPFSVAFSRPFAAPPEVIVVNRGFVAVAPPEGWPRAEAVDCFGFDVEIAGRSGDEGKARQLSWLAVGVRHRVWARVALWILRPVWRPLAYSPLGRSYPVTPASSAFANL